jgi:surface polysaccharide O-acyltransferase-like enzyme
VILSGFALAKSEEKRPFDLQIFFQRRLWRIVPPYILFTVLNIIGQSQFQKADWLERGQQILQLLSTGMGDYHLYFLGIIFQCYVLYPILRNILFTKWNLYILISITFALFGLRWVSATFDLLINITTFLPNGNHIIYWLSYFQFGIWLAKDSGWTSLLVAKWRSHIWGYLFAITAIVELSEFYWTAILKNSAEAVGHYARPTVVLLTLTFLLWSMSWSKRLRQTFRLPQSLQVDSITTFAKASFTTYLVHVWVLRAIAPLEIVGGILYVPLATSISWLIGIIIWKLLKRFAVSL